ncbi:hypothetical protein CTI12_AA629170 [Artemisia annua]|uniref:Retrotransposon gag domain-containing protein n=1 Tax=Artemisia annua TaxID=35608 RepID=A0A2U1K9D4_ARTAN|nr:hypothetical protein CTI12_AA629170 [Artemisia annua]
MSINKVVSGEKNLSDVLNGIETMTTMLQSLTTRIEHIEAVLHESQIDHVNLKGNVETGKFAHQSQPQEVHENDDLLNIDLPLFDGTLNDEDFLDWIAKVERYFVSNVIPENRQVGLVIYKLRGGAFTWWEHVPNHLQMRKQLTESWPKFKKTLVARFLPCDNNDRFLLEEYLSLSQGQKSVDDYYILDGVQVSSFNHSEPQNISFA